MATTIDEYLTVYRARDDHTPTANNVSGNLDKVSKRAEALHKNLALFAGGVKSLMGTLTAFSSGGLAAGAGLFGVLTKQALEQTGTVERLTATYAALSGSMDSAFGKMKFVKGLATSALGEFTDLAEGGSLLEGFGLRMERWLPLISNVAGAFGGTREQVISLSTALGRLMSGQAGESLERLGEFAITRSDLMRQGIRFSGGGELLSSISDTFTAIEKIGTQKFGNISKYMAGTLGQIGSNLKDTVNQALEAFGAGFAPFVKGLAGQLQPFVQFLTQSNVLADVGKKFAASFQSLLGDGGVPRFAFMIVATFERLPQLILGSRDMLIGIATTVAQTFTNGYNAIGQGIVTITNQINAALAGIRNTINQTVYTLAQTASQLFSQLSKMPFIGGQFGTAATALGAFPRLPEESFKPQQFDPIASPGEALQRLMERSGLAGMAGGIAGRTNDLMAQFAAFQSKGAGAGVPPAGAFPMFNGQGPLEKIAQNTEALGTIEKNTRPAVELRAAIIGGGARGQRGVPQIDLAGSLRSSYAGGYRPGPAKIDITLSRAASKMEEAAREVAWEVFEKGAQQLGLTR